MAEDNNPQMNSLIETLRLQNEQQKASADEAKYQRELSLALKKDNGELTDDTRKGIEELVETLAGNAGQELEDRKEANDRAKETLELLGKIADNTLPEKQTVEFEGIGQAGLGFVAALGGALTGLVTGIAAGLLGNAKKVLGLYKAGLTKAFGGLLKGITAPFKRVGTQAKGFLKPATDFFKNISRAFKAGFGGLKTFRATTGQFGKLGFFGTIGKTLGNGFRAIQGFGKTIAGFGKSIAGIGKTLAGAKFFDITKPIKGFMKGVRSLKAAFMPVSKAGGALGSVKKFLSPIGKIAKVAFNAFKAFGTVIGRLFLPIQIVMGIVDGVKGFIDGFKNQEGGFLNKLTAGIIGGISGILQGLIGIPLDLLKKGVAWIAGKLGFDSFAESLESFSFKDLIGKLFDGINSIWQGILDFFGNMFSAEGRAKNMEKLGNMMGGINDFIKKILRVILPDPDADREWYDPRGLVAKAIPSSVYRYAGLDPDTGDVLPTEDIAETIVGDDSNLRGAEMDANSRENTASEGQGQGDTVVISDTSNKQNIKTGDSILVNMSNPTVDPNLMPAYQ